MATESTPPTELDRAYSKAFKEFTSEIVDLVTIVNKARTNLENSQKDDGSFSKQGPIKDLEDAAEALERKIENIGCHGSNPSLRRKVGRLHLRIRAVEVEFVRQPPGIGYNSHHHSSGRPGMSVTMEQLGLDRLSRSDRLDLVRELWDSIAAEPGESLLSDTQRTELRRRMADDDADPDAGTPWEDVKAKARRRIGQ